MFKYWGILTKQYKNLHSIEQNKYLPCIRVVSVYFENQTEFGLLIAAGYVDVVKSSFFSLWSWFTNALYLATSSCVVYIIIFVTCDLGVFF